MTDALPLFGLSRCSYEDWPLRRQLSERAAYEPLQGIADQPVLFSLLQK
jgi:hypothetical protein